MPLTKAQTQRLASDICLMCIGPVLVSVLVVGVMVGIVRVLFW